MILQIRNIILIIISKWHLTRWTICTAQNPPWDFDIWTDHLILARVPDLMIINKKKEFLNSGLCHPSRLQCKIERKRKERLVSRPSKRTEITMEYESNGDTTCYWCIQHSYQRIGTETGGLGNKRTSGNHPNNRIIKIG